MRIVVLNGSIGIGKSTLQDILVESIEGAFGLDGDALLQCNPPLPDEADFLHEAVFAAASLYWPRGYHTCVVNHYWPRAEALGDLRRRFEDRYPQIGWHAFLLTLEEDDNRSRMVARRATRAIDESEFEDAAFAAERAALYATLDRRLGTPLDASPAPEKIALRVRRLIGI